MMKVLKAIVVLGLFVLTASTGVASGPPPAPLRDMVRYSDLIVIAEVEEVVEESQSAEFDRLIDMKARLKIQKILKGHHQEPSVEVNFWKATRLSSAGGGLYQLGEKVLVFLWVPPEKSDYWTFDAYWGVNVISADGSSSAAMVLTEEELEIKVQRIIQVNEILQIKNDDERKRKTVDWLVECAVDPKSYVWDFIYELRARRGAISRRYAHDRDFDDFPSLLTKQNRALLFAALEQSENVYWREIEIARLIKDSHAVPVVNLLLERLAPEQEYDTIRRITELIAELKNNSYLEILVRDIQVSRAKWQTNEHGYRQRIIDHFIESVRTVE